MGKTQKRRPIPIEPSSVVYADKNKELSKTSIGEWLRYFAESARSCIFAVIFISISTYFASFAYQIVNLQEATLDVILNTVFRNSLSSRYTFIAASISSLAGAWAFYPKLSLYEGNKQTIRFTRVLAGIVIMLLTDVLLFDLSALDLFYLRIDLFSYREAIYAQVTGFLLVLLFFPIHRRFASVNDPPKLRSILPPFWENAYLFVRLILVSLVIIFVSLTVSLKRLSNLLNLTEIYNFSIVGHEVDVTLAMVSGFLSALSIAAILYGLPKHRQSDWDFKVFRLALILTSVTAIGLIYRFAPHPEGVKISMLLSGAFAVIMTPLQRSLT